MTTPEDQDELLDKLSWRDDDLVLEVRDDKNKVVGKLYRDGNSWRKGFNSMPQAVISSAEVQSLLDNKRFKAKIKRAFKTSDGVLIKPESRKPPTISRRGLLQF